jgi:predicted nucleic-acid-binding protein
MHAIDTNVLVRLLSRDHLPQLRAAEAFVARGAWVSHLVLAETIWVLQAVYSLDRDRIATAVAMLLEHEQIAIQDPDIVAAALTRYSERARPGFTDCLVLEIARRAGHLPLGTFDKALARIDGAERLPAR